MTVFARCKCFLKTNIFVKEINQHVKYTSDAQFVLEYSSVIQSAGLSVDETLKQVKEEVARRKNVFSDNKKRSEEIKIKYKRLHPEIFKLQENYFHEKFLEITKLVSNSSPDQLALQLEGNKQKRYYSFPVFSNKFCDLLLEELKNFENADVPKGRPNSMNKHGVLLDELGFNEEFLNAFRTEYLQPIAVKLFPEYVLDGLDTHKAFVVKYKIGEDVDLGWHHDNAEVTLNIALNEGFDEGSLYIGPMAGEGKGVAGSESTVEEYSHKKGWGLLHRGLQMHGAMPIEYGERYNMIIWARSSSVRNLNCPMCMKKPDLEPVDVGWGEGFTMCTS
ncbi:2-oxoglutarate and iron-dependent oxygenase domain-containing protein 2-like isoform X2 [Artemia franciscana]|uniref:Fe2OG dioxygenase domain-containing protein n=1 Tax=Artemia franciscana TaxID=6661 RepID=A0AA88HUA4_ARTSF|nr:hypothetical protein QYM36_012332 [Artemia franciscana]